MKKFAFVMLSAMVLSITACVNHVPKPMPKPVDTDTIDTIVVDEDTLLIEDDGEIFDDFMPDTISFDAE